MSLADLQENLRIAAFALPIVLLAFALHEMAHAYAATWFGDPTPERHGRRTLNLIRHLDPLGTAMLVGSMLLLGFPFGFAVTPVDDERMRKPRLHGALTALAGPLVNFVLTGISMLLYIIALQTSNADSFTLGSSTTPLVVEAAFYSMIFNSFLTVFNLLPIPPLDGGRIVGSFMGDDLRREWRKIDEYGIFIVLALVFLGGNSFRSFLSSLQLALLKVVDLFVDGTPFAGGF